ncbi:hypothetical protein P4U97_17890 [Bacillus swezeyi]|uniref:hypothetical protein n=1 Tax=Bacillus swezeyi TaxID=1925020 RepID=UPI002E1CFFEB|nr:hypothetical protein [Bacillus swezeyi]
MRYYPLHCPYPRWQWQGGRSVLLETSVPQHIARALSEKGHQVEWALIPDHLEGGR